MKKNIDTNNLNSKFNSIDEWITFKDNLKIPRKKLNKIIFEHLVFEGKKEVLEQMEIETGESIHYNKILLEKRCKLRKLLVNLNISESIDLINNINPEILESNLELLYKLQKQKFIKFIINNKHDKAIEFAQDYLYKLAINSSEIFQDFEKLMIIFAYDNIETSPFSNLISEDYINNIIYEVNKEILKYQLQPEYPGLQGLIKTMLWKQNHLKKKNIKFNEVVNLMPFKTKENINSDF